MKEKKKHEPMLIVRDDGLISTQPMRPDDVIAMLLQALLNVWDQEIGEIDVAEAARDVIDFLGDLTIENLRGDDDDDDVCDGDCDACNNKCVDEADDDFGEEDLDEDEKSKTVDLGDVINAFLAVCREITSGKA